MSPQALDTRPFLSIVVPSYNEAERLKRSLPRILDYLQRRDLDAEILVVDDGSTDATAAVAEGLLRGKGRVIRVPENRGKGHAVRLGFLEARGRWVLFTDADLSTPIEEYETLAEAARRFDLDGAIGSRALPDSKVEVHQNPLREAMGKWFNWIIRRLTGLPFRDTQCGFKLFDRERILPLVRRMRVDRFAFDVELLFLCHRYGLKIREVPVTWRNDPATKVRILTDPANMFLDVLRVRWWFRRGVYHPSADPNGAPAARSRSGS